MTQEEKDLLLKDLCTRMPYDVKCKDTNINVTGTLSQIGLHYDMCTLDKDNGDSESCYILNCKPYLFPLSSMTEEQKTSHNFLKHSAYASPTKLVNWYNKNHFDYRGLIPMDLAIDATGLDIY